MPSFLRNSRIFNVNLVFVWIMILVHGCASVKKVALEYDTVSIIKQSDVFSQHHVGFALFDIEANQFLSNYNASLLFTPASNTKLLTMYATLKSFEDSIPHCFTKRQTAVCW